MKRCSRSEVHHLTSTDQPTNQTMDSENQAVLADPTTDDSLEASGSVDPPADQLYGTNASPLILDPATLSINGSDGDLVAAVSSADVATTQTIAIGSHMYIIQSHPSQATDASPLNHTFVLQPEMVGDVSAGQEEAVTLQERGGEVMGEVSYMTEQVADGSSLAAAAAASPPAAYQSLGGVEEAVSGVLSPGSLGSGEQGETITLSLEEATQLFLQQGLEGAAIQMPDGSLQLLSQQFIQVAKDDGTVESSHQLPVEVVQALGGEMLGYTHSMDGSQGHGTTATHAVLSSQQVDMVGAPDSNLNSEDSGRPPELFNNKTDAPEEDTVVIKQEVLQISPTKFTNQNNFTSQASIPVTRPLTMEVSISSSGVTTAALLGGRPEAPPAAVVKEPVVPKPDLNCPIEVTERTEIMIKGKKCVLMHNPDTKQLCAYPILPPQALTPSSSVPTPYCRPKGKKCVLMHSPDTKQLCAYPILPPQGKKRRGRPRKIKTEKVPEDAITMTEKRPEGGGSSSAVTEKAGQGLAVGGPMASQVVVSLVEKAEATMHAATGKRKVFSVALGDQNSAAEGLLELSNAGPDSVRRSARKRKKARALEDYDVLEASSDEEGNFNDDEKDPDVTMYGVKKLKVKRELPTLGSPLFMPMKRGRGRPRRYPPRGQSSSSIPAVILPSANGQTLVMAPLQGLQNIPGLQSQVKAQLQQLLPKTSLPMATGTSLLTASPSPSLQSALTASAAVSTAAAAITTTTTAATVAIPAAVVTSAGAALGPDGDALPLDTSAGGSWYLAQGLDEGVLISGSLPAESLQLGGESSDNQEGLDLVGEKDRGEGEGVSVGDEQPHTVIQIPDNLLPMFGLKKDSSPVKIGLKASESELEKLKCPKCEFQAYYAQQYQDHIAAHADDIHKCKCCNFLTFHKDDLLEHFKATHPRCICEECEFMAEHAYMIKRHMMRHNADGCTCELCGKVYKDRYILKMHVKMQGSYAP
ncbi:hypothetical protein ACOMHN_045427 [Nucella lapillus]